MPDETPEKKITMEELMGRDFDSGDMLNSFTIITTDPNALVKQIHNRMPVIYDRAMGQQWLHRNYAYSPMNLAAALRPPPSEHMEAWDVSPLVNSPDNDTPECVKQLPGHVQRGQLPLV